VVKDLMPPRSSQKTPSTAPSAVVTVTALGLSTFYNLIDSPNRSLFHGVSWQRIGQRQGSLCPSEAAVCLGCF
jgi:hypothetical protein